MKPALKGTFRDLDFQNGTGLPLCLSETSLRYLYRAIAVGMRGIRGAAPTIVWNPPITCSTQLKITLVDKQLHHDDDRRYVNATLRAQPFYSHRPAYDNIKVWIEEDEGQRLYFARYIFACTS
jgi:hypothetical protein